MTDIIYENDETANEFYVSKDQPTSYYDPVNDVFIMTKPAIENQELADGIDDLKNTKVDKSTLTTLENTISTTYETKEEVSIKTSDLLNKINEKPSESLVDTKIANTKTLIDTDIINVDNKNVNITDYQTYKTLIENTYETKEDAISSHTSLSDRISAIDQSGIDAKFTLTDAKINEVDQRLQTSINNNVVSITQKTNQTDFDALKNTIEFKGDFEDLITNIEANISSNTNNISTINNNFNILGDVTLLKETIDTNKTDMVRISGENVVIKSSLETLETSNETNRNDIINLKSSDSIFIDLFSRLLSINESMVGTLTSMDSIIKVNKETIISNTNKTNTNNALILTNSNKIDTNITKINSLQNNYNNLFVSGDEKFTKRSDFDQSVKILNSIILNKADTESITKEIDKKPSRNYINNSFSLKIHEHENYLSTELFDLKTKEMTETINKKMTSASNEPEIGYLLSRGRGGKNIWVRDKFRINSDKLELSFFIDFRNGVDTNDGLTRETPIKSFKTISNILEVSVISPKTKINIYLISSDDNEVVYYDDGSFSEFLNNVISTGNSYITFIGDTKIVLGQMTLVNGVNTDEYTNQTLSINTVTDIYKGYYLLNEILDLEGKLVKKEVFPIIHNSSQMIKSIQGLPLDNMKVIKNLINLKSLHYIDSNINNISFININFSNSNKTTHKDLHLNNEHTNFTNCSFFDITPNVFNINDIKYKYEGIRKTVPSFIKYYDKLNNKKLNLCLSGCYLEFDTGIDLKGDLEFSNCCIRGNSKKINNIDVFPSFIEIFNKNDVKININDSNSFKNLYSVFGGKFLNNLNIYNGYLTFSNIECIFSTNHSNIINHNTNVFDLDVGNTVGGFYNNEEINDFENSMIMNGLNIKVVNYFKSYFMKVPNMDLNTKAFIIKLEELSGQMRDIKNRVTRVLPNDTIDLLKNLNIYTNIHKAIKIDLFAQKEDPSIPGLIGSYDDTITYNGVGLSQTEGKSTNFPDYTLLPVVDRDNDANLNYKTVAIDLSINNIETYNLDLFYNIDMIIDNNFVLDYYKVKI